MGCVSTHNLEQFDTPFGLQWNTSRSVRCRESTKANPDPVVGIDFIRRARALTTKPIVAIGASPSPVRLK